MVGRPVLAGDGAPSLVGVSFMSAPDVEVVQRVGSTCEPVSGSDHTAAADAEADPTATLPTATTKRSMKDVPKRNPLANVLSYRGSASTISARRFPDGGSGCRNQSTDVGRD